MGVAVEAYVRFVLRHRGGVLAACAAVTLAALATLAARAELGSSLGKLFLGESPAYRTYLERSERFGGDEVLLVGLEVGPEALAGEGRRRLEEALAGVRSIPMVGRVRSPLDARLLLPGPGGIPRPVTAAEAAAASPPEAVWRALQGDPLYGGLGVARAGRGATVLVELEPDPTRPAEEAPRLVAAVRRAFAEAGYPPGAVHVSGLVGMLSGVLRETVYALQTLLPVVAAVLLGVVWLMFRRLWPAALSLGVAGLGVVWTMGFAVLLDPQINVLMAIVPAVILIVAFSDVVHLCSAYLLEVEAGASQREAIVRSGGDVGAACVLTSLTTFIGFLCLSLVPTPAFRVMGVVLGLGVAIALLQAVTLVPILFSLGAAPGPLRAGPTALVQRLLDLGLRRCDRLARRRPGWVLLAFAAALLAAGAGASQLRIETDFAARFRPDHPLRVDQRWFEARFAGWNTLDVFVTAPTPNDLRDPAWLRRVAAFQQALGELPAVEASTSLLDLFAAWRRAAGAEGSLTDAVPARRADLEAALGLLTAAGGEDTRRLVDLEQGRLRLLLRLGPAGFRATAGIGDAVRALAARHLGDDDAVAVTGLTYLLGEWLDEIVAGQREGLLVSALTIALIMVLVLRSLRGGLAAMVPNLFPLAMLGGWLGGVWRQVDSDALSLGLLAIGIGVDDTIHFLSRYRLEVGRGVAPAEAVRRTFGFAGRGIAITTVILVAGFLPFATSSYLTIGMFGTLLPACLVAALLADVLLLPAMIQLGWVRARLPTGATADPGADAGEPAAQS